MGRGVLQLLGFATEPEALSYFRPVEIWLGTGLARFAISYFVTGPKLLA